MVARTDTDLYKGTVRINITYQYFPGRRTLTCGLLLEEAEVERALGGRRGPGGGEWAERADRADAGGCYWFLHCSRVNHEVAIHFQNFVLLNSVCFYVLLPMSAKKCPLQGVCVP